MVQLDSEHLRTTCSVCFQNHCLTLKIPLIIVIKWGLHELWWPIEHSVQWNASLSMLPFRGKSKSQIDKQFYIPCVSRFQRIVRQECSSRTLGWPEFKDIHCDIAKEAWQNVQKQKRHQKKKFKPMHIKMSSFSLKRPEHNSLRHLSTNFMFPLKCTKVPWRQGQGGQCVYLLETDLR